MDYELAKSNLDKLETSFSSKPKLSENEATTRLHFIDRMLIDCLGWPIEYIEAERHYNNGYSDYELGDPQKRLLLEAKKEGVTFDLPSGFSKEICSLKTIYGLTQELKNAIDQAMKYCHDRGIPVASITNGHQYLIFMCNRQDGTPPMDGSCLVFSSLEHIKENFKLFWDSLSYVGISENKIKYLLERNQSLPPPDKLSKRTINYPGFKNRNPIAAELQILGGLFLEDIGKIPEAEEEFVRATYCNSGALSQYAMVSKEILSTRYTSFFQKEARINIKPATTKDGIEKDLKNDLITAGLSRRPIILVGDVGVGKSMFIKHLLFDGAKEELSDSIVIYLDFGIRPTFVIELDNYIINEIASQLWEKYKIDIYENSFVRGVYNLEIEKFGKGIYSSYRDKMPEKYKEQEIIFIESLLKNSENHLKACLNHIVKGRKKQIVIFLDNVDQRPYEFQERVFLTSQSLAETWPVVAFIALRPDTFVKSKASGTLAAYQPRVFTIDPPRVDRVIRKRLDYALDKIKTIGTISEKQTTIILDSNTLEKYIEMLIQAVENSKDIIEFIDNMSNGNLRKVIDFIGIFVGSAHVDSRKILDVIDKFGSYYLPLHEFLRALLYKDNEYYNPDDSLFINIYDISSDNAKDHFSILLTLAIVNHFGKQFVNEGFINTFEIYKILQNLGFKENEIETALLRCIKNSLLAVSETESDSLPKRVRILPAGAYTLMKLGCMFSYIDAIIIDTPIISSEYSDRIHDTQLIEERLARAEIFANYLLDSWEGLSNKFFNGEEYIDQIKMDINHIRYTLNKRQVYNNQQRKDE